MELDAAGGAVGRSSLMPTDTHICSLDFVAKILDEDRDLLDAILANDDNLTYGAIVTVHTGKDEAITALTNDGVIELKDMLAAARATEQTWDVFLSEFVSDPEILTRLKHRSRR